MSQGFRSVGLRVGESLSLSNSGSRIIRVIASCTHSKLPTARDAALTSAQAYLEQMAKDYDLSGVQLVGETEDRDRHLWTFDYKAGECRILIATASCDGADVSGINAACKAK